MLRCLFWNMRGAPLWKHAAAAVRERNTDVLVVTESALPAESACDELNSEYSGFVWIPDQVSGGVQMFFRFPAHRIELVLEYERLCAYNLSAGGPEPILLIGLHMPSKLWVDGHSQILESYRYRVLVEEAELRAGHERTIVIGDFNMNPFEPGMAGAGGFHAMMDRRIARKRRIRGEEYRALYNPMWSKFGDLTPGPSGTYFWRGDRVSYGWNIFDQALVRPELAGNMSASSVQILTEIAGDSLLDSNGRPDSRKFSDHLPIYLEVDLD